MNTLERFLQNSDPVPLATTWLLTDLAHALGKQELFTMQSPQKLKALKEHALIESAVSSNRIEGISIEQSRVKTVVLGKKLLKDRDEEEVRGYRNALDWIHQNGKKIPISEETILKLHRMTRPNIWDSGKYKEKPGDIIEKLPSGDQRIRFKTISPTNTPKFIKKLIQAWRDCLKENIVPSSIVMAAFNLDFLCIHPFRDGNGRVSRLLLLLQCYHLGYEVGRYISLERIIEESKDRYYETLEQSSLHWHEGKHDPWPIINYLLFTIRDAYKEFEERVGQVKDAKGAKTSLVHMAINQFKKPFSLGELERACPGVSRDMIRKVLKDLKKTKHLRCLGLGRNALWQKVGITPLKG